jgi:hypothetical protein
VIGRRAGALAFVWLLAWGGTVATPDRLHGQNEAATGLVPAGHGTLRKDEVTLSVRSGALLVKATPLSETVIRLLAPDTYYRLHTLATSRRSPLFPDRVLFLISFFSYEQETSFTPEDVQVIHRGGLLRAAEIIPVTSGFGRQRLQQQETQSAIYAFDDSFNFDLPIVVRYGLDESGDWLRVQQRLERERARVRTLTGGAATTREP